VRVELNGFAAYCEEHGSGPALVLVHGLGGSTAMFQKMSGPLSEHFRVVAYDLRGLGQSETPPLPYSITLLADDLHGLVEQLGLAQITLVGHSLGGAVAFAYAIGHPERVSALIAVAAPSATPVEQRADLEVRAEFARREGMPTMAELHARNGFPDAFRASHQEDVTTYKAIIASADADGYAGHCGVIGALDLSADVGRIRAPTLLIAGELDRVVPASAVRLTASQIPGSEYVELAGCGHLVPFERPGQLVEQIIGFVVRSKQPAATT